MADKTYLVLIIDGKLMFQTPAKLEENCYETTNSKIYFDQVGNKIMMMTVINTTIEIRLCDEVRYVSTTGIIENIIIRSVKPGKLGGKPRNKTLSNRNMNKS